MTPAPPLQDADGIVAELRKEAQTWGPLAVTASRKPPAPIANLMRDAADAIEAERTTGRTLYRALEQAEAKLAAVIKAADEIRRITDRKHDAWAEYDAARASAER
jgi:hypothetical protein